MTSRSSFRRFMSALQPLIDKSRFKQTLTISAAIPSETRLIGLYRQQLLATQELYEHFGVDPIRAEPGDRKLLLLNSAIKIDERSTWSSALRDGVDKGELSLVPFTLELDYRHFSYAEALRAILPAELDCDLPSAFSSNGHVAHFNLRTPFLPYRHVIGQLLLDKYPTFKTVINKTDNVGTTSEFRTFSYEVLAGENNLDVEVSANNCIFAFNYARVYYNSRLHPEHSRLLGLFKEGELVCDVMAGVGPFSVPAGKKRAFVLANDLNPDSFEALRSNITRNKAAQFVTAYNMDGAKFIKQSAGLVLAAAQRDPFVICPAKGAAKVSRSLRQPSATVRLNRPVTVSHYVMNLPDSAISFLPCFRGLYHGQEALLAPPVADFLPLIHVYTFVCDKDGEPDKVIVERIRDQIGSLLRVGKGHEEGQVSVHQVRSVAPNKDMYCATFRLPPDVAFAPPV